MIIERVLAYLLLLALIALGIDTAISVHYMHKYQGVRASLSAMEDANTSCHHAVDVLMQANQSWAAKFKQSNEDAAAMVSAQNAYRDQLQAKYAASQKSLNEVYAHVPQARAWSTVPVPDSVADGLRAAAHRQD